MGTFFPSAKAIERKWYVVDARGQVLGRLASRVATILMGKHKPDYTPFLDMGDHVIVINASKVKLTGKKEEKKIYRWHSGYPGGLKEVLARDLKAKHPEKLVEWAVWGMLPKTKLGKQMFRKLKVYAGEDHPHQAQQPIPLEV